MNCRKLIAALLTVLLLVSGCSSKMSIEKIDKQAEQLLGENKYEELISLYEEAWNGGADKEALKTNIVLHRQVAGVFAYLKSIPYVAGAKYLRLYASDNKKQLCLGNFAPATGELANNGTGNTNKKVINCAGAYTGKTKILEADLASWFSAIAEDGFW